MTELADRLEEALQENAKALGEVKERLAALEGAAKPNPEVAAEKKVLEDKITTLEKENADVKKKLEEAAAVPPEEEIADAQEFSCPSCRLAVAPFQAVCGNCGHALPWITKCPGCQVELDIKDHAAGATEKCPGCGRSISEDEILAQ